MQSYTASPIPSGIGLDDKNSRDLASHIVNTGNALVIKVPVFLFSILQPCFVQSLQFAQQVWRIKLFYMNGWVCCMVELKCDQSERQTSGVFLLKDGCRNFLSWPNPAFRTRIKYSEYWRSCGSRTEFSSLVVRMRPGDTSSPLKSGRVTLYKSSISTHSASLKPKFWRICSSKSLADFTFFNRSSWGSGIGTRSSSSTRGSGRYEAKRPLVSRRK